MPSSRDERLPHVFAVTDNAGATRTTEERSMKDLAPQTIELESEKVQFLQEMSKKYGLTDIGKAVRCLVNYARENPERLDEIFGEVRCLDC
jgi:hypothetical protein